MLDFFLMTPRYAGFYQTDLGEALLKIPIWNLSLASDV